MQERNGHNVTNDELEEEDDDDDVKPDSQGEATAVNRRARRRAGLQKARATKGGKISHSEMKTASKDNKRTRRRRKKKEMMTMTKTMLSLIPKGKKQL